MYKLKVNVRQVRCKLRLLLPKIFDKSWFNWKQPAFYAPRGEVTVRLSKKADGMYPGQKFRPASVMMLVALALKHPELFVEPGAFSAFSFDCLDGFVYYIAIENKEGQIVAEAIKLKKIAATGEQLDYGAHSGFIIQEVLVPEPKPKSKKKIVKPPVHGGARHRRRRR